ncbi:MAG TPA: HNH endonuclease signature motif containing protein [Gemmatimonadaceae bacterium]
MKVFASHVASGKRRRFCSVACRYAITPAQHFWSKVNKDGPVPLHRPELGPCWIWLAGRDSKGYGTVWFGKANHGAHRVSWELVHGPIPKGNGWHGACVLHRCDNPSCVNPTHLFEGTQATNMADRDAKGRGRWVNPPGEANGSAKLTEALVLEIRALAKAGVEQRQLAVRFGICNQNVSLIVRRKRWAHV